MSAEGPDGRGHAVQPHTADVIIRAWAATPEGCYEEAVGAFTEIFADIPAATRAEDAVFDVGPGGPEDLLVLLLEEVLFNAETRRGVPASTLVEVRADHLVGTFTLTPVEDIVVHGPIPKGISYHDLEFGPVDGEWHCHAIVDV